MITKLRGNGGQLINNIFGRFGNQELTSDQTATLSQEAVAGTTKIPKGRVSMAGDYGQPKRQAERRTVYGQG